MSTEDKDLYAILGVKEDAKADEIKKAYRTLAKKFHPDRTGGDKAKESKFKEISAAYEVLSDTKRRQQYDRMRHGGFQQGGGGAEGIDLSAFEGIDGIEELLGSMFGGMRGGARGGRQASAGPRVIFETRGFDGDFGGSPFAAPPRGRNGASHAAPQEQLVRTQDGAILTQKGEDFYWELELAVDEAILGTKVDVPTVDGKVTLKVPPGTSSGQKLRLRSCGRVPRHDGQRGDQYVTVKIVVPTRIDKKAEELIREFAKVAPVKPRRQ